MSAPPPARPPIAVTVPELAAACGVSRKTMARWLKASDVVLHRRGEGTARAHVYTTIPDLEASNLAHLLRAIDWSKLTVERARPREAADDDDEEDETKPVANKGKDGVWR
jgi:hypothetical protein